jgi:SAM-dependent methyltransferase
MDVFESWEAWQAVLANDRARFDQRWLYEQALCALDPRDLWEGRCVLCERDVRFEVARAADPADTNLRESLACPHCRTNARMRAGLALLRDHVPDRDAAVYITEQASPNFVWLQRRYANAIGSEYASDPDLIGHLRQYLHDLGGEGEIRCEDVTRLTFADGELDAIATFDVLEHVPDYHAALREFARTLNPGGALVLTAPFLPLSRDSVERARIGADGAIEHLLPPEYHGDPLAGEGILCFHYFGWDLLDAVRAAGFAQARMMLPWRPAHGFPSNLWTLVAVR